MVSESVEALFPDPCVASQEMGARTKDDVGQAQHNGAGLRHSSDVQRHFCRVYLYLFSMKA